MYFVTTFYSDRNFFFFLEHFIGRWQCVLYLFCILIRKIFIYFYLFISISFWGWRVLCFARYLILQDKSWRRKQKPHKQINWKYSQGLIGSRIGVKFWWSLHNLNKITKKKNWNLDIDIHCRKLAIGGGHLLRHNWDFYCKCN